ncbi:MULTISPECIES: MerR family transcriptional regulator [Streptomyces]|uniref:MerR family transcriptional regulator n=1 Tax=Streptomyces antibioticus TaxID=1890 RepID=A0AAE7CJ32_STRAT|nr:MULTISPECIES: MerR family transcriptional regulator [Streptomyces]GLV95111.1 MerR family transcriptional regulator [Streptomyces lavendulae subsp. lavendulae]KOU18348.1 MerR family transcriptional regulator [Streptomyces sp. WM6349]KOV50530.1 MerR family transcriptional regulator [Streptomyces sp. H036]MCX5167412.1 MerR family DNA-binding transcriptional regulator [Streptomyces antibioticus]OOQ54045.1 MerR family transcriptional regulator [Streptomyces antibioticus]
MSTLRISQLAGLSGVPASTLRFYETAGLLPAERTPSGYRQYGEGAVERLAFISSAKLLGLALEDIRALLDVRDAGVCAAVRARMVPLVADRIADADRRAAELAAFSARLADVHRQLSGPAPAGGCGPDCGCTATEDQVPGPVLVELSPTRPQDTVGEPWREVPVACTLGSADLGERTAQWQALVAQASERETIPEGLHLAFPSTPELAAELAALAATEQDCCTFFDFTLSLAPAQLTLTVRAPEAAGPLLADLFGATA